MSLLDEMFQIDDLDTNEEPSAISVLDFIVLAKSTMSKIADAYSRSFERKRLGDNDYPPSEICEACTGCGVFKLNGQDEECMQGDTESGECYYSHINTGDLWDEINEQIAGIEAVVQIKVEGIEC